MIECGNCSSLCDEDELQACEICGNLCCTTCLNQVDICASCVQAQCPDCGQYGDLCLCDESFRDEEEEYDYE